MGTRADFYVGNGPEMEWLGSIAWDGYPTGLENKDLLTATSEAEFRSAVATEFAARNDFTLPEKGWPWPWETSATTDYAYAFFDGRVWASHFGDPWTDPLAEEPEPVYPEFPDMSARKNVRHDRGSGLITVTGMFDGSMRVEG